MQPPYFLRRGFPPSENERTHGEGNEAAALEATTVHVVSFNFRKAFDLIDHCILASSTRECQLGNRLSERSKTTRQAESRVLFRMEHSASWSASGNEAGPVAAFGDDK